MSDNGDAKHEFSSRETPEELGNNTWVGPKSESGRGYFGYIKPSQLNTFQNTQYLNNPDPSSGK